MFLFIFYDAIFKKNKFCIQSSTFSGLQLPGIPIQHTAFYSDSAQ